jgi:phytoene synthase
MDAPPAPDLPRPFYNEWWGARRAAARALWDWHTALWHPQVPAGSEVEAYFDAERARAEAGERVRGMPESTATAAYEACATYDLPREWLGAQVEAARLLHGPTRFETADRLDTFVRLWAAPHARLLAALAGCTNSVQRSWADALGRGFFLLARLVRLPTDLAQDRLFVPRAECRKYGVGIDQLRTGPATEPLQRLLWTQSVRVRDAPQRGRLLARDLGGRRRYALRWYWHGALALLEEMQRRDYDLWTEPLRLSRFRRLEVWLQMLFGRS